MDTVHFKANPSISLDIPLLSMAIFAFEVSVNTGVMWLGEDMLLASSLFSDGGSYYQFFR